MLASASYVFKCSETEANNEESESMGISEAIKSINAAAASPGNVSEEERVEALRACERLKASLETPFEYTLRVIFSVLNPSILIIQI